MPADRQPDDLTLLSQWRNGDDAAGATLVTRYFPRLMRFFRNKVHTVEDAKDLVGETMLACTRGRAEIHGEDVRKYVFGVAMNKLREYYRKRVKRAREEADFSELCVADFDTPGSPATVLARKREVQLLARALRRLPLDQQIVVELSHFEGHRAPAIAELLDVPVQTVYTRLRRGKQRLHEIISAMSDDPDLVQSTLVGIETWAVQIRNRLAAAN